MEISKLHSEPELLGPQGAAETPAARPDRPAPEPDPSFPEVGTGQLDKVAKALEQFTASMGKELQFQVHEESDRIQVNVIDPRDKKIIKKIPPDEILALAASIEKTVGLFLDKTL